MKRIEVSLPDEVAQALASASSSEVDAVLMRAERLLNLFHHHDESRLRKWVAYYLLGAGSLILVVSLGLVVLNAFAITQLGHAEVSTLIGSVAVEFVGMLWMVVRYLFPQGAKNDR